MEKLIRANLRFLGVPLGILATIVVLSLVSFKIFSDRSTDENNQIATLTAQSSILDQKLSALQTVGSTINAAQNISLALPSDNPTFIISNQIKRYSQDTSVSVESVQIGQEVVDTKGVSHADVSVDAVGNPISILAFANKLKNASPLTLGNNIVITQKGGETRATIALSVFWAAFPEKLPAITEPISELTADEKEIIAKIAALQTPFLVTGTEQPVASQPATPKSNPFGF
ncbi:MAG TPA: hypothetical protein VF185_03430 [Patescibacteria group bacterium]